jgi:hypothetical protein
MFYVKPRLARQQGRRALRERQLAGGTPGLAPAAH